MAFLWLSIGLNFYTYYGSNQYGLWSCEKCSYRAMVNFRLSKVQCERIKFELFCAVSLKGNNSTIWEDLPSSTLWQPIGVVCRIRRLGDAVCPSVSCNPRKAALGPCYRKRVSRRHHHSERLAWCKRWWVWWGWVVEVEAPIGKVWSQLSFILLAL